ncbi:STAS domain-containing protein [Trujillonella humicola]|uniref:STAS domain-containing protein n=1 Tax=Trujillonella humicola TaxID=3383699 RepID=UPI003905F191
MSVTTARTESGASVSVRGEVDCSTAPRMRDCIDSLLAAAPRELVVDLTEVTFLDSAGLHALVTARSRADEAGARLRVLVATRAALRPIQVTGLWDVLGVEVVERSSGAA